MSTVILMDDPIKYEEFLKKLFIRQDKNKDGTLDFNEIKQLLQIFTNCSVYELKEQFNKLDLNNNGLISFSEFKILFENILNKLKEKKRKN